jgi:hypothetical protein
MKELLRTCGPGLGLGVPHEGISRTRLDNGFVQVFISFDMEGAAGIADWAQCRPPGQAPERVPRVDLR